MIEVYGMQILELETKVFEELETIKQKRMDDENKLM